VLIEGGVPKSPRASVRLGRGSELRKLTANAKVRKRPPVRPIVRTTRRPSKPASSAPETSPPTTAGVVPNDPLWRDSWSLAKVNALGAWSSTTGLTETVVAVLDTGVDLTHPDLQGAFVAGYDTVNEDADPSDDHGHGTMVAGVIAARSNNGIGVVGACWRCSLMPVKVIAGNGLGSAADVAEGISWATTHGARVINLSFTLSAWDAGVAAAIDRARASGVVLVAAAGNTGTDATTFPASHPGVVSVAGSDGADARYLWSSYGSWVRLAAPGCSLTTAAGAAYGEFCGTSSATGFVSGLAGLARSYAPTFSPDAIAKALTTSTVPVGDFVSTGRVDAARVIGALRASR